MIKFASLSFFGEKLWYSGKVADDRSLNFLDPIQEIIFVKCEVLDLKLVLVYGFRFRYFL